MNYICYKCLNSGYKFEALICQLIQTKCLRQQDKIIIIIEAMCLI